MLQSRIIDFIFAIYPDRTFGELSVFAKGLFEMRDYIKNGFDVTGELGVIDGKAINSFSIPGKNISYRLEYENVSYIIHDNEGEEPNQDFSREILTFMSVHYGDKTIADLFGLKEEYSTPLDLYRIWIYLVEHFNKTTEGIPHHNLCINKTDDIKFMFVKLSPVQPDLITGKVTIHKGIETQFITLNTNAIPFKSAMEMRNKWVYQTGSFIPEPTLSSNPDFTQKDY